MQDMTDALESLLVCESLSADDRDCVEQALDDGYVTLSPVDKARVRRLLNRQAARPVSALQRYRLRRRVGSALLAARREDLDARMGACH